jgi:hypothetical protein
MEQKAEKPQLQLTATLTQPQVQAAVAVAYMALKAHTAAAYRLTERFLMCRPVIAEIQAVKAQH